MDVRYGRFAVFQGTEYQAIWHGVDGKITLLTKDSSSLSKGFTPKEDDATVFRMTLMETEVEEGYTLTPFAEYQGHKFQLVQNRLGKWALFYDGKDKTIVEKMGFNRLDRFEFAKEIELDQLDRTWEEKSSWDLDRK